MNDGPKEARETLMTLETVQRGQELYIETRRISCGAVKKTDKSIVNCKMISYPFDATTLPFSATYELWETAAIHRTLNERATGDEFINTFYVEDYLGSFGETMAKEHLVGLTELPIKNGLHVTKWIFEDPGILESILLDELPEETGRPQVFSTTFKSTFRVGWDPGTIQFV